MVVLVITVVVVAIIVMAPFALVVRTSVLRKNWDGDNTVGGMVFKESYTFTVFQPA